MANYEQINLAKTTNDANTIELLLQMGDLDTKIALLNNPNCKELTAANFIDNLTLEDIDENFEELITIPSINISNKVLKIPNLTIKRLLAIYNISPSKEVLDKLNELLKDDSVSVDTDDINKLSSITAILGRLIWRIDKSKLHITEEQLRIMISTDEGKQIVEDNYYDLKYQFGYFLYKELHIYKDSLLKYLDKENKLSSDDYIDIMSKLSKTEALKFFMYYGENMPNNFYDEEIFNAYIEQYVNCRKLYERDIENLISHINKYSFSSAQLSNLYGKILNDTISFESRNDMDQLADAIFSRCDTSSINELLIRLVENSEYKPYIGDRRGYTYSELEFIKRCKLSKEFFIEYGIFELYDHPSVTIDIIADVIIKGNLYSCRKALENLSKNDLYQIFDKIFLTGDIKIIRELVEEAIEHLHNIDLLVDFITTSRHDYGIRCDLHALQHFQCSELDETRADALLNATLNKDICKAILMHDRKYCVEITKDLDLDTLTTDDAYRLIESKYCTVELLRKFNKDEYENDGIIRRIVGSPMCPSDILAYWAVKNRHDFNFYRDILNNPNYDQNVNDAIVNNLTSTEITSWMCDGWTDYNTIRYLDKSPYLTREQRISLCCTQSEGNIFYILPNNLTESEITTLFKCWENSEFELPLLEKLMTQPNCPTKILLKAVRLGVKDAINHSKITPDLLEQIVDICKPEYYDSILCEKCNCNTIIKIVKNGYDDIDKLKDIIESKIASSTEDYKKFTNAHLTIIDKILDQIK